jgi:endonuclease/exonuclease/phosphatase family metal-dependent hydrolase
VRIVTWNVFDLPEQLFAIESAKRMDQIAGALAQACQPIGSVDAIVLTELYVDKDKSHVLSGLARLGFVHHAQLQGNRLLDRFRPSGIVVASRWPIETQASIPFGKGCHGFDCFVTKGTLYARLIKTLHGHIEPINLFGTHFYLGRPGQYAEDRKMQASALRAFMQDKLRSSDEIAILAGDLNAAWSADGPALLAHLGGYPIEPSGEVGYTFVGESGHLLSGSPTQSVSQRCHRHASQRQGFGDAQAGRKWIDYVVALAFGRKPSEAHLRVVEANGQTYTFGASSGTSCQTTELSDHHPVVGEFLFD